MATFDRYARAIHFYNWGSNCGQHSDTNHMSLLFGRMWCEPTLCGTWSVGRHVQQRMARRGSHALRTDNFPWSIGRAVHGRFHLDELARMAMDAVHSSHLGLHRRENESYVALILTEKAVEVRKETGNWAIHSRQERIEFNPREMVRKYFTRPIKMLFTEPIVFLVSLYMSFIYGIVYALLVAYPYVFEEIYDMNPGVRGLPFLGLITGVVLAVIVILALHGTYANKLKLNNDVPIPEWRLEYPIIGAPIFTIGLFW
jgi:hypothetical protein